MRADQSLMSHPSTPHVNGAGSGRWTVEPEQLKGGWLYQVIDTHGGCPPSLPMALPAAQEEAARRNARDDLTTELDGPWGTEGEVPE